MKYIGIDFGDGTTSASLLATDAKNNAYQDDKGEPQPPKVMDIINEGFVQDRSEVPSLLAYPVDKDRNFDPSRKCFVGTKAATTGQEDYELRSNWKFRPTQQEETPGYSREAKIEDMKNFMSTIWELYQGTNGKQDAKGVKIVIGAPSGWNGEDRKAYAFWATEAGLPNVTVLSESTAAFLYSRKFLSYVDANGESHHVSDDMLKNGILLVDVGSSTTDFTYARGMYESRHWGFPLGAKYIDEAVLRFNLNRIGETGGDAADISRILFSDENLELRSRVLFKCRALKEKFFTNKASAGGKPVVVSNVESVPFGEKWVDFYIFDKNSPARTVSPSFWDDLLEKGCKPDSRLAPMPDSRNKGPWRVSFRSALAYVKKYVVKPENGAGLTIILTGGASRMDFVEADIKTVFGKEVPLLVGAGNDRAFSVANGLAWAGYAQDKIESAKTDILQKTGKFMTAQPIRDEIRHTVVRPIAAFMMQALVPQLVDAMANSPSKMDTLRKQGQKAREILDTILKSEEFIRFADDTNKSITENRSIAELVKNFWKVSGISASMQAIQNEFSRTSISPRKIASLNMGKTKFTFDITSILKNAQYVLSEQIVLGFYAAICTVLAYFFLSEEEFDAWWKKQKLKKLDQPIPLSRLVQQLEQLQTPQYRRKLSSNIAKTLCTTSGKTESLLDILASNLSDAVVGTQKDELDALAGQFKDAQ